MPPPILELPEHVRTIAEQWPDGAYEAQGAGHLAYCCGQPRPPRDIDRSWQARIVQIGARPLLDAKAGVKHVSPVPAMPVKPRPTIDYSKPGEDDALAAWRAAAAAAIGQGAYRALLDAAELVLDDEQLTIVVASPVAEMSLRNEYEYRLTPIVGSVLHRRLLRLEVRRRAA